MTKFIETAKVASQQAIEQREFADKLAARRCQIESDRRMREMSLINKFPIKSRYGKRF